MRLVVDLKTGVALDFSLAISVRSSDLPGRGGPSGAAEWPAVWPARLEPVPVEEEAPAPPSEEPEEPVEEAPRRRRNRGGRGRGKSRRALALTGTM